ncbi:MAG: radical SAM protein [Desulfobacter sp.]
MRNNTTQQADLFSFSPEHAGDLETAARVFLSAYGTPGLLGREWAGIFEGADPGQRFDAMLDACGFSQDAPGFFAAIHDKISRASADGAVARVCFNGIDLPALFLYHILETRDSSQRLISVDTTDGLAAATGMAVRDPGEIQQVLDLYPVRLSRHVVRQSAVSAAVAAQYLPFAGELDSLGHTLTFDGHFKQGLMEQMYRNRAIFLLDMRCPVYCRFCFRKHKSLRREPSPSRADVAAAVARVRENTEITEILITGGEPLLNPKNLEAALKGLMDVDHVRTLRIATRSLAYYPHLFLHHGRGLVSYLKQQQALCLEKGKRIEIGVHLVHPDEISVQTLDIISDFTASGIPVYVQTPFLQGLNHEGRVLETLFALVRRAGAEIYYIFTPCHPIHGTRKYWSPISVSMDAYCHLRANLSDRAVPKLCTATPLGKMEWHTSGWAVEKDSQDPGHIWIRTPYTRAYFENSAGGDCRLPDTRENPDDTLDVKCLIDMGDDTLFAGSHDPGRVPELPDAADLPPADRIQEQFYRDRCLTPVLAKDPCPGLRRVHKTRVEMEAALSPAAMAYLSDHPDITDIVLRLPDVPGSTDPVGSGISRARACLKRLDALPGRTFYIRLRWEAFWKTPERFTPAHVSELRALAEFSIARPRRIEIETWWLHPGQVTPIHASLALALSQAGIPAYANMVLVPGLNNDPASAVRMARVLRQSDMAFHHIYVAGTAVQNRLNADRPVDTDQVLAMASRVRKECSGREIPLYMVWTPLGEVDFGLNGIPARQMNGKGAAMYMRVLPYGRDYLEAVWPGQAWAGTEETGVIREAGNQKTGTTGLAVRVSGLACASGFRCRDMD